SSFSDAMRLEAVRYPDDLVEELRIRDRLALVDRLALPVERDLVTESRIDVTIETVVGDVELASDVPLRVREVPFQERRERLEPGDPLAALALPELLERDLVDVRLGVRLRCEVGGRRIPPILREQRLDRLVGHAT